MSVLIAYLIGGLIFLLTGIISEKVRKGKYGLKRSDIYIFPLFVLLWFPIALLIFAKN